GGPPLLTYRRPRLGPYPRPVPTGGGKGPGAAVADGLRGADLLRHVAALGRGGAGGPGRGPGVRRRGQPRGRLRRARGPALRPLGPRPRAGAARGRRGARAVPGGGMPRAGAAVAAAGLRGRGGFAGARRPAVPIQPG